MSGGAPSIGTSNAAGTLEPRQNWGHWRTLDPDALRHEVEKDPDATLEESGERLGVHFTTVWHGLKRQNLTLKIGRYLERDEVQR